jgi:hypothetical protein
MSFKIYSIFATRTDHMRFALATLFPLSNQSSSEWSFAKVLLRRNEVHYISIFHAIMIFSGQIYGGTYCSLFHYALPNAEVT